MKKAVITEGGLVAPRSNPGGSEPADLFAIKVTATVSDGDESYIEGTRLDTGEAVRITQHGKKVCPLSSKLDMPVASIAMPTGDPNEGTQVGIGEGTIVMAENVKVDADGNMSASVLRGLNQNNRESTISNNGNPIPVGLLLYKGKSYDPQTGSFDNHKSGYTGMVMSVRGDHSEGVKEGSIQDVIDAATEAARKEVSIFGSSKTGSVVILAADGSSAVQPVAIPDLTREGWQINRANIKLGNDYEKHTKLTSEHYLTTDQRVEAFKANLTKRLESFNLGDGEGGTIKADQFGDFGFPFGDVAIVVSSSHKMTMPDVMNHVYEILVQDDKYETRGEAYKAQRDAGGPTFYPALINNVVAKSGVSSDNPRLNMTQAPMNMDEAIVFAAATQFPEINAEAALASLETMRKEVRAAYSNKPVAATPGAADSVPDEAPVEDIHDNAGFDEPADFGEADDIPDFH